MIHTCNNRFDSLLRDALKCPSTRLHVAISTFVEHGLYSVKNSSRQNSTSTLRTTFTLRAVSPPVSSTRPGPHSRLDGKQSSHCTPFRVAALPWASSRAVQSRFWTSNVSGLVPLRAPSTTACSHLFTLINAFFYIRMRTCTYTSTNTHTSYIPLSSLTYKNSTLTMIQLLLDSVHCSIQNAYQ